MENLKELTKLIAVRKKFWLIGILAILLYTAFVVMSVLVLRFGKNFGLWAIAFVALALFIFYYMMGVDKLICKKLRIIFCEKLIYMPTSKQLTQNISVLVTSSYNFYNIEIVCNNTYNFNIISASKQIAETISSEINYAIPIKVEVLYHP